MAPMLMATGPELVQIGWVLVAFVVVFLGTLLGIALGEYDIPAPAPRARRVRLLRAAGVAAASMSQTR